MKERVRKHWVLIFACTAIAALTLLSVGLPDLRLRPWQRFVVSGREEGQESDAKPAESPAGVKTISSAAIVNGALVLLLVVGTVIIVVNKEIRKRFLFRLCLLVVVLLALVPLIRWRLDTVPQQPSEDALPLAAEPSAPGGMLVEFDPTPPRWLTWGAGALLSAAVAVAVVGIVWLLWPRGRSRAGPLGQLAAEAQSTLAALKAGSDVRDTILRCYFEMSRTLSQERGIERPPPMTPREFEQGLVLVGLPEAPVRRLTRLFERVRYGAKATAEAEEQEAVDCLAAIVEASRSPA